MNNLIDINKDIYVSSSVFWNDLQQLDGFVLRGGVDTDKIKSGEEHCGIIVNGNNYQKIFLNYE